MQLRLSTTIAAVLLAVVTSSSALANDFAPQIEAFVAKQITPWLGDKVVVDSINAQNAKHASLDDAQVTALDDAWRAEAKADGGPMIEGVLGNDLSKFLQGKKDGSNGFISEMFIMDNKGMNVGQSDVTSDYMQGDEDKWQKTYLVGPGTMFIDEVEFDDSSKTFQSQVSITIVDPATNQAIGAITVGINVENL